jgi:hypothetical protein
MVSTSVETGAVPDEKRRRNDADSALVLPIIFDSCTQMKRDYVFAD